ncbi:MoaD/ThiS family protein [uncultured Streptomyces sp.]|uniref:MoaD/ThiS family protein n=1 Tax=uncultured Streptomyces sp. TaxID=174707 RepID=UPI003438237C
MDVTHHGQPEGQDGAAARTAPRPDDEEGGAMASGTIRYWAAAKSAAGTAEEPYRAATLAEALDAVRAAHPGELTQVLRRCAFLIDGNPVGNREHETVRLAEGGTVEVLPPFAGG